MTEKDGNLAFKCTWNDFGFKGICSKEAYEYNISKNRAWCRKAPCRTFEGPPTGDDHPCYESIIFTEWRFGAGWDHKVVERPRKILKVRVGGIALLTTLEPNKLEKERKIIGFLKIKRIGKGEEKETVIYGDSAKSLEIDPSINIRFWNYYKNPRVPNRHVWGTGLFRYIDDEPALNFLKDLKRIYNDKKLANDAILKIDQNIRSYEKTPLQKLPSHDLEKLCGNCGHANLEQAKFCNKCGKPLVTKCLRCQTPNPWGSQYCFHCGAKLNETVRDYSLAIRDKLLGFGRDQLNKPSPWIFTPEIRADKLLQEDPNAFLFGAIFDQGIDAERAWAIPYELKKRLGHLDPKRIARMSEGELKEHFGKVPKLHRFWRKMAGRIRNACVLLEENYDGNAQNIWGDKPESRKLYKRLIKFDGIGQKKASMVTNILSRDLGVEVKDKSGIDVSYDEMVRRIFLRAGLVKSDTMENVVEAARGLNPEYPGELDYPAWLTGRSWCLPKNPKCDECYLNEVCPKVGI